MSPVSGGHPAKVDRFGIRDAGRSNAGARGKDEDRDGGFAHGGGTWPYWHDQIGETFGRFIQDIDGLLLGRRTYVIHAEAFEPNPAQDPFGTGRSTSVSKTLEKPIWRDTTIIRDKPIGAIRALKAEST